MSRRLWLWPVYFLALLGVTVAGAEFIASFSAPSWPARDLRPIPVEAMQVNAAKAFADGLELHYNDWAIRDRPRSIERPSDVRFRSVLVGDSFLEGSYHTPPLSELIERRWADEGRTGMEAINLGINATSPRHYYYRIRNVAVRLDPDVIVVFVYAGNDFIETRLEAFAVPPLIDELPSPSLLGTVAPRTTWLLANRLGSLEIARANKDIPGEFAMLNEWAAQPSAERFERIVRHMKTYYYPGVSEDTIREILSRGGNGLAAAAMKRGPDREYLAGWLLSTIIEWETAKWEIPRSAEEADRMVGDSRVDETLSWLVGAEQVARAHGSQLIVALVPVGVVDPSYVEFWRPWPNYFSYSMSSDSRHRRLATALRQRGMPLIDLRETLNGIRGTYRVTDGHWTDLGTRIVAERMSNELLLARARLVAGKRPADR